MCESRGAINQPVLRGNAQVSGKAQTPISEALCFLLVCAVISKHGDIDAWPDNDAAPYPGFRSFPIQEPRSRGGDRLVPIELESVDHSEGLLMLQFAGSTVGPGERWAKSCWTNDF